MGEQLPSHVRIDIQVLRGFAVLIVVLYHAKIAAFEGGYLGVDVFFVISGFLITRMVRDGLDRGTFRFSDFYLKRAKRLLPAAYVTFLVTAILTPLFLAPSELEDFKGQMLGAVTFLSNVVLWHQSGYFSGDSELKPLLHVWSLSIEEQYYFVLPALMFFVPRRLWKPAAVALVVASLSLCLYFVSRKASATFYLLPTRGWELGLGSLGALIGASAVQTRVLRWAFWPAVVLLLGVAFFPVGSYHPGPDAILACAATLVIILRKHPIFESLPIMNAPAKIGDISYSLYLVHWPLFAFLNNAWIRSSEGPTLSWRLGVLVVSFILAAALHRFVEQPCRRLQVVRPKKLIFRTIGATTLLALAAVGVADANNTGKDFVHLRRYNLGLSEHCDVAGRFQPSPACSTSKDPTLLLWGDSFMMHLVPGVVSADPAAKVAQATLSACGPLLGVSILKPSTGYGSAWPLECMAFNDSVLDYLAATDSIEVVVLSSAFANYVNQGELLLSVRGAAAELNTTSPGIAVALAGLRETVEGVRRLGKRVVLIAPPPAGGFDSARCLERQELGLLTITLSAGCQISHDDYRSEAANVPEFLERAPLEADIEVVSFDPILCSKQACETSIEGVALYRDSGHLSYAGSVALATRAKLLQEISTKAR